MKPLTIALVIGAAYVAYRAYKKRGAAKPCCDDCAAGAKTCGGAMPAGETPPFVPTSDPFAPVRPIGLDAELSSGTGPIIGGTFGSCGGAA